MPVSSNLLQCHSSAYLSACLFQSVPLSYLCISMCLSLSDCSNIIALHIYLSVCLFQSVVKPYLCIPTYLSVCLFQSVSTPNSVYLYVCLSLSVMPLYIYLYVCVRLSTSVSHSLSLSNSFFLSSTHTQNVFLTLLTPLIFFLISLGLNRFRFFSNNHTITSRNTIDMQNRSMKKKFN